MLYKNLLRPLLFRLDPETAHELAIKSLRVCLSTEAARRFSRSSLHRSPFGKLERFGISFDNPLGLAAGFDKNGTATEELASVGFGFLEIGTVTRYPQPGNPRPRIFRLPEDLALINRAGFNNAGAEELAAKLTRSRPDCILGINIGKSRKVPIEDAVEDYLATFELVYNFADFITINVSSPNTPQLRELQKPDSLKTLLSNIQRLNQRLSDERSVKRVPLLVKISPDMNSSDLEEIVSIAVEQGCSGLIATNTTISREGLRTSTKELQTIGEGGLSGAPLGSRSTAIVSKLFRLSKGRIRIIGVGGIFDANDAWEKVSAGASLIQTYTGFIYKGVTIARDINEGLQEILLKNGIKSFDDAVGCRAHELEEKF